MGDSALLLESGLFVTSVSNKLFPHLPPARVILETVASVAAQLFH